MKDFRNGSLSSPVFPLSSLRLPLRRTNQADASEEQNTAQNQINERRLRDATFGKVDAAVDQPDQAGQGQNKADYTFGSHCGRINW